MIVLSLSSNDTSDRVAGQIPDLIQSHEESLFVKSLVSQSNSDSYQRSNGTSSSGKTTIAKALQEKLTEPYMYVSIDNFFHMHLERVSENLSK